MDVFEKSADFAEKSCFFQSFKYSLLKIGMVLMKPLNLYAVIPIFVPIPKLFIRFKAKIPSVFRSKLFNYPVLISYVYKLTLKFSTYVIIDEDLALLIS